MPSDSYHAGAVRTFECRDCSSRVEAPHAPGKCPDCGGNMQDISVTRE